MKKLLLILGVVSFSCFADADIQPYGGAYINLNSGFASFASLPVGSWTGNINAGYNFNRGFALEGGYNLLAGQQFGVSTTTSIFDLAAKGTIPLSEVFNLYGRAGLGWGINGFSGTPNSSGCALCNSLNNGNFMLGLAGIGASFTLDKHFDLRLEDTGYIPLTSSYTGMINAVTFGIQYNF